MIISFLTGRKKILTLGSIILGVLLYSQHLFAYDETIIHPSLTIEAAKLYNLNFEEKLTNQEIDWIRQGSIDEDDVDYLTLRARSSNHFYDPVNKTGWTNTMTLEILGEPSPVWAHDSVKQSIFPRGDYTWERAIYDYVNGDKKHAYEGLGHILHLIEDKTVPAHTRNDFHLSPTIAGYDMGEREPFEDWTRNNARVGNIKFDFSQNLFQESKKPIIFDNLNQYFENVALYTNTGFFSQDTVNKYSKPLILFEKAEKTDEGKTISYAYGVDEYYQNFRLAKIDSYSDTKLYIVNTNDIEGTEKVNSDYWSRLAPKSILAGAGIIKLFKDEVKKASQNPVAVQKPDTFASYYFTKPAAKTAVAVNSAIVATANNIVSGLNQIKDKISYSLTPSASSNYTLVFDMSQAIPASSIKFFGGVAQIQSAKATEPAQSQISQKPIYSAALVSQSEPEIIADPNKEINLKVQFKNTGAANWQQDKIYLNVYLKNDVSNQFYHSSWLTSIRPAKLTEPQVNSGSFGNFNFLIKSPPSAGDYFFKVRPVWQDDADNFNWLGDGVASWKIKVTRGEELMTEPKNISTENIADALQEKEQPTEIKNAEQEKQIRDNDTAKKENDTADKEVEIAQDNARAEGEAKEQSAKDTEKENQKEIAGATEENQGDTNNFQNPDSAGVSTANDQPAPRRRWRDIYPPETSITFNPSFLTNQKTAVFKFSSSEVDPNFYCRLDSGDFALCEENTVYNLSDGAHRLEVKAEDRFRNIDLTPAEFSWTIDSAPPAKIINLAAVAGNTRGKIKLSWIKPEENILYEIRYSEKEIVETGATENQANWQDAVQISETIDNNAEQIEVGSATQFSLGRQYHFAIKATDDIGNISEISNSASSAANAEVNYIVISEIQIDSINGVGGTNDDWIELYNPTANEIPLSGWSIQRQTKNGTLAKRNFEANSKISAHSFFLLVSTQAAQELLSKKDLTFSTFDLTDDNVIYLVSNNEEIIDANDSDVVDKLGWGSEALSAETSVAGNPLDGGSLERKANYSSTAESMSGGTDKYLGNGWDSDNNSADFVLRTVSDPQNASSPVEPRYAPVKISDFSATGVTGDSHAVKLTWSAPYGAFGNPQNLLYDIRYSTAEITSQNFSSAILVLSIPSVGASGAAQELTIENLSLGQTYYFAVKTKDNTGLESEISFTSYAFPSSVFLQNLSMAYFAFSVNNGGDGYWPQVSQTTGTGLSQRLVKATARVKCIHTSECDVRYKVFIISSFYDSDYNNPVQNDGLNSSSNSVSSPFFIPAGNDMDVNFSGWTPFTFNPTYYYKITFQFNVLGSAIQWGGSSADSYPNGNSIDYSGGADIYFKLSTE